MQTKNKIAVLILAAGIGKRAASKQAKQFVMMQGKPLLTYTIQSFLNYSNDLDIYIVLQKEAKKICQNLVQEYFPKENITLLEGGKERFHSTQNALLQIDDYEKILIHDAARPFISNRLIKEGINALDKNIAAIPVFQVTDSLRKIENNSKSKIVDRSKYVQVQTPQFFQGKIIKEVFKDRTYQTFYSDDASVLEDAGYTIHLFEGEKNNIKITYPIDFKLGELILNSL